MAISAAERELSHFQRPSQSALGCQPRVLLGPLYFCYVSCWFVSFSLAVLSLGTTNCLVRFRDKESVLGSNTSLHNSNPYIKHELRETDLSR